MAKSAPLPACDLIGRELEVGNAVAFCPHKRYLTVGCIKAFTPKMVRIEYRWLGRVRDSLQYAHGLVLLEGPALIEYQLKKSLD